MELICPACKTRYLVPDDAIPASGRQVSCTECHHGWQAFPPRIPGADSLEGAPQTPVSAESPGPGAAPAVARPSAPDAPQATARTFPSAEADAELADPARAAAEPGEDLVPRTEPRGEDTPDFPTGSEAPSYHPAPEASAASNRIRQQQLTEIRKMLAEVQSGHSRARASAIGDPDAVLPPTEGAEEGAGKDGVTASTELRRDGASVPLDATKEPRKPKDATPRQADAEPGASDRDQRAAEQHAAPDAAPDAAGGDPDYVAPPGFLRTGLLVIVLIAAVMTALYLLQPQITARLPSTGPALTKYIEMIDKLRAHIASDYEWVKGKIAGEDSPAADPSPANQNPAGTAAEPGGSSDAGNGRRAAETRPETGATTGPETGAATGSVTDRESRTASPTR